MSAGPTRRRKGIARKLALSGFVLIVGLACAEWISRRAGYEAHLARARAVAILESFETLGAATLEAGAPVAQRVGFHQVLHPYLAYESDIGIRTVERQIGEHLRERRSEIFTVLVFGGSVAQQHLGVQFGARDVLRERLQEMPLLAGRRLRIFSMARAGYKQPQQMLSLASFLARGAVPDVVINLDGFNELVLGATNPSHGLPAAWPSANHWAHVARGGDLPTEALDHYAAMRRLEREARSMAARSERLPLFASALSGRVQLARLQRIRNEWAREQNRYADLLLEGSAPIIAEDEVPSFEEALEAAADNWAGSSRVMHELCSSRGILYLHCIQPALHLPGTKPITEAERASGIGAGELDPKVVQGYPLLQARAAELAALGVQVLDLTELFADVEETLYFDNCHFLRPGHVLLAERLARELQARLQG